MNLGSFLIDKSEYSSMLLCEHTQNIYLVAKEGTVDQNTRNRLHAVNGDHDVSIACERLYDLNKLRLP